MMEILDGKYEGNTEESDFFHRADKSTMDQVLTLQKALLNVINTNVGSEIMNRRVAIKVITDRRTKQYTGVKKDKIERAAERQPRH
jgi:hypothetical protein